MRSLDHQFDWLGHTDIWPERSDNWLIQRDILFLRYESWARSLAFRLFAKYKSAGMDADDYVQYASIGLLEAIEKFDPARGVHFKLYAKSRIQGSILNSIVKFSEAAQSKYAYNKVLKERLLSLENARDTQANPQDIIVNIILDLATGFLLESEPNEKEYIRVSDSNFDSVEISALKAKVFDSFELLDDKSKLVMTGHYRDYKSFSIISEEMNMSAGRISQIHTNAIRTLRRKITF